MNTSGHSATLVASHPGNQNRLVHGGYSTGRTLSPLAAEIADALMEAEHTVPLDRLAAEEIGQTYALLERIDAALEDGHVENKRGQVRALVDLRLRASGRLERWLREFGLTPAARAEWAARLASGGLSGEIARRRNGDAG